IRLGARNEDNVPFIRDYVPLADMDDLVVGGWDVYEDDAYVAASRAGVRENHLLELLGDELRAIKPMTAVFEQDFVRNLHGDHVKPETNKMELAEALNADIDRFVEQNGCDRVVAVWCGSTEVYKEPSEVHESLDAFEQGLQDSHPDHAQSQIYADACLKRGIPYANGAPNLNLDTPALIELARQNNVPFTGKDFKTGQTLIKTIMAPGLKSRMLGVDGWYSTN